MEEDAAGSDDTNISPDPEHQTDTSVPRIVVTGPEFSESSSNETPQMGEPGPIVTNSTTQDPPPPSIASHNTPRDPTVGGGTPTQIPPPIGPYFIPRPTPYGYPPNH